MAAEGDDWQSHKTLYECNKHMLESGVNSDVTFLVGPGRVAVQAHRFILSSRSLVFDRMLNGDFREGVGDTAVLPEVDTATFNTVLRYCYYDSCQMDTEVAFTTMSFAKEYMLPLLEQAARKTVIKNISDENLAALIHHAFAIGDDELYRECVQKVHVCLSPLNLAEIMGYAMSSNDQNLIDVCMDQLKPYLRPTNVWEVYELSLEHSKSQAIDLCRTSFREDASFVRDALRHETFLSVPYEVMLDFLYINLISDEPQQQAQDEQEEDEEGDGAEATSARHFGIFLSDIELFQACNRWAERQCTLHDLQVTGHNKRAVLKDCLKLTRFPTMLYKDLVNIVYPTGILTDGEINWLSQFEFGNSDESNTNENRQSASIQFPSSPRCFLTEFRKLAQVMEIECAERVKLWGLWIERHGTFTVTVADTQTGSSQSLKCPAQSDTKHFRSVKPAHDSLLKKVGKVGMGLGKVGVGLVFGGRRTPQGDAEQQEDHNCRFRKLGYLEIIPIVLEANRTYRISVVGQGRIRPSRGEEKEDGAVILNDLFTPPCIQISCDGGFWMSCSLSLSLV